MPDRRNIALHRLIASCAIAAASLLLASCDKNQLGPIDYKNSAPLVLTTTIAPDSVLIDTLAPQNGLYSIGTAITATVSDPDGPADIREVDYRFTQPGTSNAIAVGTLSQTSADSSVLTFTGSVSFGIGYSDIGTYRIQISARDQSFAASNTRLLSLFVARHRNSPPVIVSLDVPDSIQRPASGTNLIPFHTTVADSDGLGDIDSVYFRNFTSTNPTNILMYDDGDVVNHGDAVAGDGIYSRIVSIDPTTTTGQKEFHFFAVDKTGARDEKILIITVY